MDVLFWIVAFLAESAFAAWIVWGGGAARLEGTFRAGLLVSVWAPGWSAEGIRLFVGIGWVFSAMAFVLGLFVPGMRG